jgi:hypothetical protein
MLAVVIKALAEVMPVEMLSVAVEMFVEISFVLKSVGMVALVE